MKTALAIGLAAISSPGMVPAGEGGGAGEVQSILAPPDTVFGVFEGRTPCGPLAVAFTGFPSRGCEKIKWRLSLFRDARTGAPTRFLYQGTRGSRTGTWSIEHPSTAPGRTVYRLRYGTPERVLSLLAIDDDVLLLLDENLRVVVGDASGSYALNRVRTR